MENIANMNGNEIGMAIIPLLWVFGLMAVCVVAYIGKRMNEKDRQRIGAELELIKDYHFSSAPNEAIVTWLRKKGLEAKEASWNSENEATATKVVNDGSLSTGGFEIVSPPLTDGDHVGWFTKIAKAIRGLGKPDTSCGYHVHIGLKDSGSRWGDGQITRQEAQRIAGRVAYGYGYFQSAFNALVSRSRRGTASYVGSNAFMVDNDECSTTKVLIGRDWDEDGETVSHYSDDPKVISEKHYMRCLDAGRYVNLNVESISKHGTIEFRQHQGTANAAKGVAWADLCYLFVQRCSDFATWQTCTEYPDNTDGLMQFIGLSVDDDLRHFWTKRAAVLDGSLRRLNRERGLVTIKACEYCEQIACEGQCETGVDSLDADMVEHFAGRDENRIVECVACGYQYRTDMIEDLTPMRFIGHLDSTAHEGYCENCEEVSYFHMSGGLLISLIMGVSPLVLMAAVIINCGIGAIHRGLRRMGNRKRMAHLWRGLEARGGQAAGVGWVNEDDTKNLWYFKHPQTATSLAPSLKKHITKATVYAMLHTRFATHGKNDSANAHPHFGPNAKVMMVHNGVVHNHDDVWDALNIKATGPVDSQAIAACLEIGGVEEVVKHCEGSMSLIWTDRRDPHGTLKCWTNGGNPLVMGRLDDANKGAVVIASTEAILSKAMGKRLKTIWDCSIGREYTINPNGNISKRDIKGSAETADTYFSWRSYGDLTKTNTNYRSIGKPKYDSYNYKQLGIDPERDNCEINLGDMVVSSADEDQAYSLMENDGSWAAFNGFHGYCSQTHEGISPDGDYYQLDVMVHYITDMKRIMAGEYQTDKLDWNGAEWRDLDLAQEQINLGHRDYDTF